MIRVFVIAVISANTIPAAGQCPPQWQEVGAAFPTDSYADGGVMDYDQSRSRLVMYAPAQTFEWDSNNWQLQGSVLSQRYSAAGCFDRFSGRLLLFGGYYSQTAVFRSLWAWDGTDWTLLSTNGPTNRYLHSQCFDDTRRALVLFGGRDSADEVLRDTWEYANGVWLLRSEFGPAPRVEHRMAFDVARNVVVLYGGRLANGTNVSDTWEWNGHSWTLKQSAAPFGPRVFGAVIYHRQRERVWMIGGNSGSGNQGDVWEWNGATWTPFETVGLTPRANHFAAYVDSEAAVLVFGKTVSRRVSRLTIPAAPIIEEDLQSTISCVGGPISLNVLASGAGPFTYHWMRNEMELPEHFGPTLTIAECDNSDAGEYTCAVSNGCGTAHSSVAVVTVEPDLVPNGSVDTGDLTLVLLYFGIAGLATPADVNRDGVVNTTDLVLLLSRFGRTCSI